MTIKTKQVIENKNFIGRAYERSLLTQIASKIKSAIIAVYGRRRVGKTELLEQSYRSRNLLKFEGLEGKNQQAQREHVLYELAKYTQDPMLGKLKLTTWIDVFELIARHVKTGVWTVYFEEVQWLANYSGEFASELKYVWDNSFRYNPNLLLILCGSSPSFMIHEVIRSKALYNRSMYEIPLREFTLIESTGFFPKHAQKEIMDAYLVLGGIPEYLQKVNNESSIFLGICSQAFVPGGFLLTEHIKIFVSSFASNNFYQLIIEFLSKRRFATRNEITTYLKAKSGGTLTDVLNDLELCGFIEKYIPYNSRQETTLIRYCIRDAYLNFYFSFIKPIQKFIENGDYLKQPSSAIKHESFRRWLGYAFERFCRRNHQLIANILRFSAVKYRCGVFFNRATSATNPGYQIDLIFDRDDHVITICEVKYTQTKVSGQVISDFEKKINLMPNRHKKTIHKVLITNNGASKSLINEGYFDNIITLEDIFETSNWQ